MCHTRRRMRSRWTNNKLLSQRQNSENNKLLSQRQKNLKIGRRTEVCIRTLSLLTKQTSLKEINPFCQCEHAFSHFLKHDSQGSTKRTSPKPVLSFDIQCPLKSALLFLEEKKNHSAVIKVEELKFLFCLLLIGVFMTLKHLVSLQARTSPSVQAELSLCTPTYVEKERD